MSDKKKQVTSKGGNSFLTIKSAENNEPAADQAKTVSIGVNQAQTKNSTEKPAPARPVQRRKTKSEEEKIEEFANKVSDFLDKIEGLRLIVAAVIQKRYAENLGKITMLMMKGKLKFLRPLLPMIIIIQKINEQWFNGAVINDEPDEPVEEPQKQANKKPVSFLELAEKNIIFTDNRKRPLYTLEQLKDKSGYVASESVVAPMIMENIIKAFGEVAPKAKAIPTPEMGKYAGVPMTEVMQNISDGDIMEFLEYVRNYPRGYVGKNYRITESFAGWAVSGTPED